MSKWESAKDVLLLVLIWVAVGLLAVLRGVLEAASLLFIGFAIVVGGLVAIKAFCPDLLLELAK